MKTNIFSIQPDLSALQKGEFNGLSFVLGVDDIQYPDLSLIIMYKKDKDSEPLFMITLSKRTAESPIQSLSMYGHNIVDGQLLFSEPSADTFISQAHQWVQQHHEKKPNTWPPKLIHYPHIQQSRRSDFGTIEEYRYQYHEDAQTEDAQVPYILACIAPQESNPCLVLYVEQSKQNKELVHMFFKNKHTLSICTLDSDKPRKQLLQLAQDFLDSWEEEPSENVDFPIPILNLSHEEINRVLRQEQMYEHSLLIILISTIGFVLFSLISIPYIGWFFLILSFFCWLLSAAHAVYSYTALTPNYSIQLPASTLLLLPLFFPQYGPALFLFIMMATPILLRKAIKSKGIRISGNGIQEDDKLLLIARKMSIEQDAKSSAH